MNKNKLKNIILEEYQKIKQQLNEQTYISIKTGKELDILTLKKKHEKLPDKSMSFDDYINYLLQNNKIKKKSSSSSNSNNSEYETKILNPINKLSQEIDDFWSGVERNGSKSAHDVLFSSQGIQGSWNDDEERARNVWLKSRGNKEIKEATRILALEKQLGFTEKLSVSSTKNDRDNNDPGTVPGTAAETVLAVLKQIALRITKPINYTINWSIIHPDGSINPYIVDPEIDDDQD